MTIVLDGASAAVAVSGTRRWWALAALALAVLVVGIDGTVLSVALPTLAKALHASESDLQWFSSGYFLVLAAAMLPAGLLGDRYGRKKVLLFSLALFGVGSVACAYSTSVAEFLAARVLVGLGGAGLIVMAFSVLTVLFSKAERPKAVGVMSAVTFVAFPIGPILGGWLLTSYWWGWVFLINVPVVLVGLAAVIALVPESRAAQRPGLDLVGVALSATGLVALTYGLIQAGQDGWGDAGALALMIAGVGLLVGFFGWERRLTRRPGGQPLIDLSLFSSASFTWGVILAVVPIMAMLGILFTMPQYFQGVLGTDAMGSGLRLLPLVGGLVAGAFPASRIVGLVGAKVAVAAGFVLLAAGLVAGAMTSVSSGGLYVAAWLAVAGLGTGIAMATAMSAALVELSADKSGVGSAVTQAVNKTRGSARHRHPRQRAERRLPGPPAPGGSTAGRRRGRPPERLRRRGGRHKDRFGFAARLGAGGLRARHGPGAGRVRWHRRGGRRPHLDLPSGVERLTKTVQPGMDKDGEAAETLPAITGQAA